MVLLSPFLESSLGVLSCLPLPTLARLRKLWLVLLFLRLIMFHSLRLVSSQLPCCSTKFVFVREDASTPSLAPLCRVSFLVLERRDKFFCLQIGSRKDVVSGDHLKPVFSDEPVSPVLPPARGRPTIQTVLSSTSTDYWFLSLLHIFIC